MSTTPSGAKTRPGLRSTERAALRDRFAIDCTAPEPRRLARASPPSPPSRVDALPPRGSGSELSSHSYDRHDIACVTCKSDGDTLASRQSVSFAGAMQVNVAL